MQMVGANASDAGLAETFSAKISVTEELVAPPRNSTMGGEDWKTNEFRNADVHVQKRMWGNGFASRGRPRHSAVRTNRTVLDHLRTVARKREVQSCRGPCGEEFRGPGGKHGISLHDKVKRRNLLNDKLRFGTRKIDGI